MKKNAGIYIILNKKNRKYYLGSSLDLRKRKDHHFCTLRYGKHHCSKLQHSFNKYGEENFEFIILIKVNTSPENLILLEQKYLDVYTPYIDNYNIRTQTTKSTFGMKKSCGRVAWNRGISVPENIRQKISKTLTGKFIGVNHPRVKPILQFTLENIFIKEWDCGISQLSKQLSLSPSGISNCINNRTFSSGNFIWKYKN